MLRAGPVTGNEGIETLDPVDDPDALEEVERAIGHWRLGAMPLGPQDVEDLVGAHRFVPGKQDLEHAPAKGRQMRARFCALALCRRKGRGDATAMIVLPEARAVHLACLAVPS